MQITDEDRRDMATDFVSALLAFRGTSGTAEGKAAIAMEACDMANVLEAELLRRHPNMDATVKV